MNTDDILDVIDESAARIFRKAMAQVMAAWEKNAGEWSCGEERATMASDQLRRDFCRIVNDEFRFAEARIRSLYTNDHPMARRFDCVIHHMIEAKKDATLYDIYAKMFCLPHYVPAAKRP